MAIRNTSEPKTPRTKYCPVCGTETELSGCFRKWGYSIVQCSRCGLGSTLLKKDFNPLHIYSEDYFRGQVKDGYADYVGSEPILRRQFRTVVDHLKSTEHASGKLLEIGCAYGFFLMEAREHFQVYGIETNARAVEFCRARGLDVKCGTVSEQFLSEKGPFDVVVMLDVIEHVTDPHELLTFIHRHLAPGGLILITTGDWNSVVSHLMRSHWRLMTPPQHAFFFSNKTLPALLSRLGFKTVEVSHPWKLVPSSLVLFQLARMMGLKPKNIQFLSQVPLPVNLFDAMRVVAVRP